MAVISKKTVFPNVVDLPSGEAIFSLLKPLRRKLKKEISRRRKDNILIATWNIRAFENIARVNKKHGSKKWISDQGDSPKRDILSIAHIVEIISRFDVVAVQEVKTSLSALRYAMKLLGDKWSFILTDVNRGEGGNKERLAYIFNTKRVKLSGLAGEIQPLFPKSATTVQGDDDSEPASNDDIVSRFLRPPYAVSFQTVKTKRTFVLLTVHIAYTDKEIRTREISTIARWIAGWSNELSQWNHSLIVLGDFNIDNTGDNNFKALTKYGLHIPKELADFPRNITANGKKKNRYYDQMAWFAKKLPLKFKTGGVFNFKIGYFKDRPANFTSWRLSDHYPLWAEFEV